MTHKPTWQAVFLAQVHVCVAATPERTGPLTTLYQFDGFTDGTEPESARVQGADGNFYGTASYGVSGNLGTVFKLTPAGLLAVLHSFEGVDGSTPYSALILAADGSCYGTTADGGTLATARSHYVGGSPVQDHLRRYVFQHLCLHAAERRRQAARRAAAGQ